MTLTTRLSRLLLAGASLSFAPLAFAQDPAPVTTTTESTESAQVSEDEEEITVTATRRATKIQSTPIAITAVGEKTIENASIRETQTLTAVVPSLAFPQSESSASVTARIRGVGTQGSNPGLESAVGIFIDGVYRSRNSVGFGDLGDIQRVEVLRGPQGTLFGRNTSAGLISVITREPSLDETQGSATATFESFDGWYFTGGMTAPLVEGEQGIRVFGSYRKVDGYMDILSGPSNVRDGNKKESWSLRGQYLYRADDSFSARLILDAAHRDDECCYAAVLRPGNFGRGTLAAPGPNVYQTLQQILGYPGTANYNTIEDQIGYANRAHPQIVDDWGASLELTANLGWADFTSVTGYRDWRLEGGSDADYTGADILWTDPNTSFQEFKTFTQEFRLAGTAGPVDWLVGAFYSHETLDRETTTYNGAHTEAFLSLYNLGASTTATRSTLAAVQALRPGTTPYATLFGNQNTHALGTGLNDLYSQTADSIALFTHNVINVTDAFKITLGLRYTSENKEIDATYRTRQNAGCAYLESIWGYNPGGIFAPGVGNAAGSSAPGASAYCLPWTRGALDVLTASAPVHEEKTENEWSGIVTLAYEFDEDFNAYATYSRGYKAGGFNLDRYFSTDNGTFAGSSIVTCPDGSDGSPAQTDLSGNIVTPARPYTCARPSIIRAPSLAFDPEFVNAYEIGAKMTLFDGMMTLNLAAFYQDFENYQLNTFTGISFVVTSVPEVITKGIEADFTIFTEVDGLVFNGGVTYADARYGDDLGSPSIPGSFIYENLNLYLLPGNRLTSAPLWTVTGGVTYEFPINDGAWTGLVHMDGRWVSDQVTGSNLDPAKTQEAFATFNLRVGFSTEDDKFTLEFWAKNLFDERYYQIAFDAPTQGSSPNARTPVTATSYNATTPLNYSQIGAFLAEPQTMGVTAKFKF